MFAKKYDRSGFSMITSLFVIVVMATVAAFVMHLSSKNTKTTVVQYQHAQAELYAKSYTEYAVMAVTANNRAPNCLTDIDGTIGQYSTGQGYQVRVRIAYIGSNTVGLSNCSATRVLSTGVATPQTPLTALIDVYVDYLDPDNNNQKMTVHRRTVQKI